MMTVSTVNLLKRRGTLRRISFRCLMVTAIAVTGCVHTSSVNNFTQKTAKVPAPAPVTQPQPQIEKSVPQPEAKSEAESAVMLVSGEEGSETVAEPALQPIPESWISEEPLDCQCDLQLGAVSLVELEQIALGSNPTLRQAEASITRARNLKYQVGLKPNPTVGMFAQQLADEGTDQVGVFYEQQIVRGNKLGLNRNVLAHATQSQIWELEAQRQRVLTDVRVAYFELCAAHQRRNVARTFAEVTQKGLEVARVRFESQESTKVEVMQAEVQHREATLTLTQAEIAITMSQRNLAAIVGLPDLSEVMVEPLQNTQLLELDWDVERERIQCNSPEFAFAVQQVSQARAELSRQQVQAVPNLTVNLGTGFDNGTDAAMVNLQVGGSLPVRNANEGNIAAAYAEYCRATHEVERMQNDLRSRLALVAQRYDSARAAVMTYEQQVIPQAQSAYELASSAYQLGEFSFIEILVLRRTLLDVQLKAIEARKELAQARAEIDGLLLRGGLTAPSELSTSDELRGQSLSGE